MGKLSFSVHGGTFRSAAATKAALLTRCGPAVHQAALAVQAGIQRSTPVRTGALRRSWTTLPPAWDGSRLSSTLGTNLPYAGPVNRRGRSAGYLQAGISQATPQAVAQLRAGLAAVPGTLWSTHAE